MYSRRTISLASLHKNLIYFQDAIILFICFFFSTLLQTVEEKILCPDGWLCVCVCVGSLHTTK